MVGVAVFSLTLPMTRLAVVDLDPVWIGLTRALLAALPADGLLVLAVIAAAIGYAEGARWPSAASRGSRRSSCCRPS
jgi:hypothetical protein